MHKLQWLIPYILDMHDKSDINEQNAKINENRVCDVISAAIIWGKHVMEKSLNKRRGASQSEEDANIRPRTVQLREAL